MKSTLLTMTFITISCGIFESDRVKPYIPGTYTKLIQNEYNLGNDTLMIQKTSSNVYTIKRRLAVIKIRGGKQMPIERKGEIWTALYNEKEQILHETQVGKKISFLVEDGKLKD